MNKIAAEINKLFKESGLSSEAFLQTINLTPVQFHKLSLDTSDASTEGLLDILERAERYKEQYMLTDEQAKELQEALEEKAEGLQKR